MLTISIDVGAPAPAYRQIADQVRDLIVEGKLAPGQELPSVRRLSIDLGLHFNTIAEAYRTLAADGWLDLSQGRAARVRQRDTPGEADPAAQPDFRRRLRNLITEARLRGLTTADIVGEFDSILKEAKS